jgi:hypothetical protein
MTTPENIFSIDVETWGPYPGKYDLAAVGAISLLNGALFYCQLRPIEHGEDKLFHIDDESLEIHKLNPHDPTNLEQAEGAKAFVDWVKKQPRPRIAATFSTFDYGFLYPWLCELGGGSPFSHSFLEIKSLYMGVYGTQWRETVKGKIGEKHPELLAGLPPHTHNALDDAKEQADLLKRILEESRVKQAYLHGDRKVEVPVGG